MGDLPTVSTESALRDWDVGSGISERLAADVLRLESFEGLDPQLPAGGPDGGKDILCTKDDTSFVVGCYFPHKPVSFAAIKKKFTGDLKASLKHGRDGFIFVTNQQLTPTQRDVLEKTASANGRLFLLYHRDRLRIVLDSPVGYGIRLRYLKIPLMADEQFAYFANSRDSVASALHQNERMLRALVEEVRTLSGAQLSLARQTAAVVQAVVRQETTDLAAMLQAMPVPRQAEVGLQEGLANRLSAPLIKLIHRLTMPENLEQIAGKYRATQVWLADSTGRRVDDLECPAWDKVPSLLDSLVDSWNNDYPDLQSATRRGKIAAMARFFHAFLAIHPFVDGNGRCARQVLDLQARELFGVGLAAELDRGAAYYAALRIADQGEFVSLEGLLDYALTKQGIVSN